MTLSAVIFDMDGVILDSEPVYQALQRAMFAELGICATDEEEAMFVGLPDRRMWKYLVRTRGLPHSVADLERMSKERFVAYLDSPGIGPVAGAVELIESLHRAGIRLVIASSSARTTIEKVARQLRIAGRFAGFVSGTEVAAGKPAPDVYLKAAQVAGMHPSECVAIEDSHHGVAAAKAAGMVCVGLDRPNAPARQDLSAADLIVEGPADLSPMRLAGLLESRQGPRRTG